MENSVSSSGASGNSIASASANAFLAPNGITCMSLITPAALSALRVFGRPQLLTVLAIAIVGKSGFHYLMERLFRIARRLGPPMHVSRMRYRIGLVMLFLPLAVSFLAPRVAIVHETVTHWTYAAVNDTLFLASFFVLGGEFWDKVKSLFIYEAKAMLPHTAQSTAGDS